MKTGLKYLAIIVGIVIIGIAGILFYEDAKYPGQIEGGHAWYQLKSTLPQCSFNGTAFQQTPCYAPPNSHYE